MERGERGERILNRDARSVAQTRKAKVALGLCRVPVCCPSRAAAPCGCEILSRGSCALSTIEAGGQGRNRTSDTVIFSHVLYQLSYLAS
jgi:hypothetical protein